MKHEQTCSSSLIERTIFDDQENTFIVYFKNGAAYEYSGFDVDDYDNFVNASSQGSYFTRNIKNNFSFSKLS